MDSIKLIMVLLIYFSLSGSTQSALLTVGKEGANYAIIQEAIDAANPGDIIEVQNGTYFEHVNADKAIVLRGIGYPVIDSNGNGSAVRLGEDGIELEGFVMITGNQSGIEISYNNNLTIRNNIIRNNLAGIIIYKSINSSIIGNNICNNKDIGLDLDGSSFCVIGHNIIYNNTAGIDLRGANKNIIRDNLIVDNTAHGVSLKNRLLSEAGPEGFSDGNLLERNQIEGSKYGIHLVYSEGNYISSNRLIKNEYGIYADRSLNNTIKNSDYVNNTQNESSDGQSRNNIWRPHPYAVLLGLGFIFVLINIVLGGVIGIAAGASIKMILKFSTLGWISNAILGIIGSVVGFYSCLFFFSSDLLVSSIAAAASAFILILLVEIPRRSGRKINI